MMPACYHHDVRTTLTVDEDVYARLESEARASGKSFKDTVNELLRLGLSVRQSAPPAHAFRVRPRRMGLLPGLQLENVAGLLEQVEGPRHK
jgi:hypothetical protein